MKDIYMTRPGSPDCPDETIWIDNSERVKVITAPLSELIEEMDNARECDLTTQTFGLILGVALGRTVERDLQAGMDSLYTDYLRKCYSHLSHWTKLQPEVFGVVVVRTLPDAFYARLTGWPLDEMEKRIFYAGIMLGRTMEEGSSYHKFALANPEAMDELVCMASESSWWLEERQ